MTECISMDPAVCHGKPVIKGTRVLVSTILGALGGGDSREDVVRDYAITDEQIAAALEFLQTPLPGLVAELGETRGEVGHG